MMPVDVDAEQGAAARARAAHERMKDAQMQRDAAIRDAVTDGVSLRQLAQIVGISHQRVAQIAKE